MVLSRDLSQELKRQKLSLAQRVFADLLSIGYKPKDAFAGAMLWDNNARPSDNERMMRELMNNNMYFRDYIQSIGKREEPKCPATIVHSDPRINTTEECESSDGKILRVTKKLRDKDTVIEELEAVLPTLEGKDKADVIMKIADLQQMKKEKVKDEIQLVHYYLPLQCTNCSLRMKAEIEQNKGSE